jgi:hypothetical protein
MPNVQTIAIDVCKFCAFFVQVFVVYNRLNACANSPVYLAFVQTAAFGSTNKNFHNDKNNYRGEYHKH